MGKSTIPDDKYTSWSGTSMGTPHVAGVAGLLWMYFPDCKNYQIRNVLLATAEDLGNSGCDTKYGVGLVQAKKAYELLSQGNCGGNVGKVSPVGGCEQAVPDPNAPTPGPSSPTTAPVPGAPTLFPTESAPTPFPVNPPSTAFPTESTPTEYPTQTTPTEYPTGTVPTLFPTQSSPSTPTGPAPTQFPTETAPTMYP